MEAMKVVKNAAIAIAISIVITVMTGIVPSTPAMLVGASWYGLPASWLIKMVVAPQYSPWKIQYANLIIDIVFWFVIIGVLYLWTCLVPRKSTGKRKK